jgi:hypothetical protein
MTDNTFVAPDTDDLDAFSSLMFGSAKPAEVVEEPTPDHDDQDDVLENTHEDTADAVDDADAQDPDLEDQEPEPAPQPKKKTAQERINELTAKQREAERQVEAERADKLALQTRLAELEARAKAETPKPVENNEGPSPTAVNEDGSLKYPLGEFDPTYIADLTVFTIDKVTKEREAEAAQAAAQKAAQDHLTQLNQGWQNKIAETEKTIPDFRAKGQELVGAFSNIAPDYGEFLAQTIMGLDAGPEVLYHLANHIDEAQAIVSKGPLGAAIALGRLEARFAKSEEQPKPRVSAAPKPAPSTARGVAVGGEVKGDTDDLDAFSAAFFATRKRK